MAKILLLLSALIVSLIMCKAASTGNGFPVINSSTGEEFGTDSETNSAKKYEASQNQRQKRLYDYSSYDYLPYDLPSTYVYPSNPHYSKRDESQNTGVYGSQQTTLSLILRRLQEVVTNVKQHDAVRYSQPSIPTYIPFFYIPPIDCGCHSNNKNPTPPVITPRPTVSTNNLKPPNVSTSVMPQNITLDDRVGIDDKRQNWGVLVNKTDSDGISDEDDGSRPINFNPVIPDEPINIPVPPVEHGTIQAGLQPAQIPNQVKRQEPNVSGNSLSENNKVHLNSSPETITLSLCDGAIISCCVQNDITMKCFQQQGCENPYIYGKPCDVDVQLRVIDRFQKFHKQRAG